MSEQRSNNISLHLLSLAYFSMGTGTLAVVGTLPQIASSLGLRQSDVAFLVSIFAVTFAFSAPAMQILIGHWSRRRLVLAGLVIMTVGAVASAVSPNYGSLLAARVITAIGAAAIGPVASALGTSLVQKEKQGHALAVVFSGMTISTVLGVPLSTWLGATLGWRPTFLIIGLLTLLVGVLVARFVNEGSHGHRLSFSHLIDVLLRPATAAGIAVMALEMSGMFVSYTMIVPMLHEHFGVGMRTVSAVLMVYGIAGILGNFIARRISHIWSADRAVTVALTTLMSVFTALHFAQANLQTAIAILIVWAISSDVFMPSQQRRMVELAPGIRGLVLALNSSAIYIGMAVGSFAAGSLNPRIGLTGLPLASMIFIALSFLALQISRRSTASPTSNSAHTK